MKRKLKFIIIHFLLIIFLNNCWAWQLPLTCKVTGKTITCKDKNGNEIPIIPPPSEPGGSTTATNPDPIEEQKQQIATPILSPREETSNNTITISITCDTSEATIYYTSDGSEPIIDSSKSIKKVSRSSIQQKNPISREISSKAQVYTGEAIKISDEGSHTIKAVATKEGMLNSEIASGSYTIDKTIPTVTINEDKQYLSGNEGAINEQVITWNSNRDGTYTIRKDSASCTDGSSIADGSVVAGNTISNTIQASSLSKGSNILRVCVKDSISTNTGSQTIEIFRDDDEPTIAASPGSQSSTTSHSVILECDDTSGSGCDKIVYTEDSTEPQINQQTGEIISGNLYVSELTPADNSITTYKYIARDNVGNVSSVLSSTYTVDTGTALVNITSKSPVTYGNVNNDIYLTWNSNKNGTYTVRIGSSTCSNGQLASGVNTSGSVTGGSSINTRIYASSLASGSNEIRICIQNLTGDYGYQTTSYYKDDIAPTRGNSGILTVSNLSSTTLTLNWTAASDNYFSGNYLRYKIIRSIQNNISSVTDAEANGTLVQNWTYNTTSVNVPDLTIGSLNYFNVIVMDYVGNKTIYTVKSQWTAPDNLSYSGSPYTYTKGITISSLAPSVTGTVTGYSISPTLPSSLSIHPTTGVISGTPSVEDGKRTYTITASNSGGGSTSTTISINVRVCYAWGCFQDTGLGTVVFTGAGTYSGKNLMWMKCSQGQYFNSTTNTCDGTAVTYQFCSNNNNDCNGGSNTGLLGSFLNGATSQAYDQCKYLNNISFSGYTNWRVPYISELKSIVYCSDGKSTPLDNGTTCGNSPVTNKLFNNTFITYDRTAAYLSRNSVSGTTVWGIVYHDGFTGEFGQKNQSGAVRCVRSQ